MDSPRQLVVFHLDEWRYALHLADVRRIVMVTEITPLPKAPAIVAGVVNYQGRIIPVIDIRKRFNLPARETRLSDHLVLAATSRRSVALVADAVSGVVERPESEITAPDKIVPGLEYVEGVLKLDDGLILIHNLEKFLSIEEGETLEQAMAPA
jgi:purine-binding chemotaxis protein CheW